MSQTADELLTTVAELSQAMQDVLRHQAEVLAAIEIELGRIRPPAELLEDQ